jgi:hypothetical protein
MPGEIPMIQMPLLMAALAVAWPQETDATKRALDIVRKVDGIITWDPQAADKTVIGLNL